MCMENVTKDHDLSQSQLALGNNYLEKIFSGRQTSEMESIALPVLNSENLQATTWDDLPYNFCFASSHGELYQIPSSLLPTFTRVKLWCVKQSVPYWISLLQACLTTVINHILIRVVSTF